MSEETARQIARVERKIPRVDSFAGVFVRMDEGLAVVNVGTETLRLQTEGWYPPLAGMPVRIQAMNGALRVTGPNLALNPRGTVTAVDGEWVTVLVDGVEHVLRYMGPYMPIETDDVVINWNVPIVLGEESGAPETAQPGTNPGVSQSFTDLVVQATSSGRYYGGGLRGDDVWASPSNMGGWFYGGGLGALAGANVTRAEIYLPLYSDANYGGADQVMIGRHPHPDRPGTPPTLSATVALNPETGWVGLPGDWGNFFRDNPTHGVGVWVPSSGFFKWRGVRDDPFSGALRFAGTR
jgi:hypothetical protein